MYHNGGLDTDYVLGNHKTQSINYVWFFLEENKNDAIIF